ncbi:polyprotein [Pennisetum glaucum marafivirus]|nr:polyprotein [Pennisetum glaucum marafivirus]
MEKAISFLTPTNHRETITAPLLERIAAPFRGSLQRYPWAVPAELMPFLQRSGIETSGFGFKAHPHPVHKTIETHVIHDVWPHYATTQSSMLFMKPSKFLKVQAQQPNFTALHNYRLVPKDTTRYPETSPHLPDTETVFMHDALMYFDPEQIVDLFARKPNIQKLYATLVVPPESSFTHHSFYPKLYRFRFQGQDLVYSLEQNAAHNYTQPRSALRWLTTSTIYGPGVTLTVSRLDSWGPVHSLLIQRGKPPIHVDDDTVEFTTPEAYALPQPASLHQDLRHRLVPAKVYNELFVYVRAVRTLRTTDPAGFVRTQCSKPEYDWVTSAAWDNLQNFALKTAAVRPGFDHLMFKSLWAQVDHWCRHHTLALLTAATPFAALACATIVKAGETLYHSHLDELVVARHRLVGSQPFRLSIWKERLPLFRIKMHRECTGWTFFQGSIFETRPFDNLCRSLGKKPAFARFLPTRPIGGKWLWAMAAVAAVPAALLAIRWVLGPDSPQALHDRYQATFHADPWRLILHRGPITVGRRSFLPLQDLDTPKPQPPDSPGPPPPSPAGESESASFTPEKPAPAATQPQAQAPPVATPAPAEAIEKDHPPSVPAAAAEAPPSARPVEPPSETQKQESQRPSPSEEAAMLCGERAPSPPNPLLTVEPTGEVYSREPAGPVTEDPERVALQIDPTADGPIGLYSELHPDCYEPRTGDFLARNRNSSRSDLEYPSGVDCLLKAVAQATNISVQALWTTLTAELPDSMLNPIEVQTHGLSTNHFAVLARIYRLRARFLTKFGDITLGVQDATSSFTIRHTGEYAGMGHFELVADTETSLPPPINGGGAEDLAAAIMRYHAPDGTVLPIFQVHTRVTKPPRAKNLVSNMKNGFDGIMANVDPAHPNFAREQILKLDGVLDISVPRKVRLVHIAGFAGCGKSWPIAKLLTTPSFRNHKIAVPTVELRAEWKELMNYRANEAWRVGTWESSLLKSARVLVVDEVYKMPRGYVDLAIHSDAAVEFVILLGDPLQGEYHASHPQSTNARLHSEIIELSPYIDAYCWWSRRIPKRIAKCLGVPTLSSKQGFVSFRRELPSKLRILVNSQSAMKTLNQLGYQAITIASSQGSTYRSPACIHLDRNSRLLSHQNSLVAVTRSTEGIIFTGDFALLDGTPSANYILSHVAQEKEVDLRALLSLIAPKVPYLVAPIKSRKLTLRGGVAGLPEKISPDYRGDVIIDCDAAFLGLGDECMPRVSTHFLPETRRPLHIDIASALPSSADRPQAPDHSATAYEPIYPGETFENVAAHFLPAHDPADKEINFRGMLSNQFPHINMPFELSAQPSNLLAAIHSSKHDPTLLPASISKRLRFRPSTRPYQITAKDELLGGLLFEGLCRAYHRSPELTHPFNEQLFIECIGLNEFAQLSSKTQAVIMANACRSDPDWRWTAVRIFAKAQHKVNEGSIFGPWKACQTLALMHDAVVLLLGPVKKYQRVFDQAERPSHLYVHAGHTPFEMSRWCQENLTRGEHLANDYTAFDQSQHGEAVVLERKKMERLSIPQHLIDLHVYLKTNVETQFGPLTCMRLTGEPGTYDDNTDYNIAIIHLEYAVGNTPLMVSGDDSLLDREPPVRPDWSYIKDLLALRFKKEKGRYATFCGYYVGADGAVRSPVALFAKLMIAVDDSSISDKLAAYVTEFAVGHSLGDQLWNVLPIECVRYQSACFDFFCRKAPVEMKLCFKIGEVPLPLLERAFQHIKWASHAVYALLNFKHRRQLLHSSRQGRSLPDDPEVSKLQGELLQTFQSNIKLPLSGGLMENALNCSTLTPDVPLPLSGALNSGYDPAPLYQSAQMTTLATNAGPAPQTDDRVDRQPLLPPAPLVVETAAPHIDLPFQWLLGNAPGDKNYYVTDAMATSVNISKLMAGYRHATLTKLEVEVVPLAAAFAKPITTTLVWTISSLTPSTTNELAYYGGRQLTLGGPVLMGSTTTVPCDLTRINPHLKSSVTYNDTPRLTYTTYANSGAANAPLINFIVRGIIRLSGPSGNAF